MESKKLAAPMNREVGSSKSYSMLKTSETYIETMGIDVPSNRKLLAYNRVRKVWQQLICLFIKEFALDILSLNHNLHISDNLIVECFSGRMYCDAHERRMPVKEVARKKEGKTSYKI